MIPATVDVSPPEAINTLEPGDKPRTSLFDRLRDVSQVCRQVFGIPDYERYLTHAAMRHPGEPVLSRREYCARAIERKYGKNGPRCC